jgi:hypothetical protein
MCKRNKGSDAYVLSTKSNPYDGLSRDQFEIHVGVNSKPGTGDMNVARSIAMPCGAVTLLDPSTQRR